LDALLRHGRYVRILRRAGLRRDPQYADLARVPHGLERRYDIEIRIDVIACERHGPLSTSAERHIDHIDVRSLCEGGRKELRGTSRIDPDFQLPRIGLR